MMYSASKTVDLLVVSSDSMMAVMRVAWMAVMMVELTVWRKERT